MMEVWPACLTAGLTYGVVQYIVSNYVGASLAAIGASVTSMIALVVLLKSGSRPQSGHSVTKIARKGPKSMLTGAATQPAGSSRHGCLGSCSPRFVFTWGLTPVKTFLNGGTAKEPNFMSGISSISMNVPILHKAITRTPPVVAKAAVEPAVFTFNWASATGTSLLLREASAVCCWALRRPI
ncbi:MAG: L-lactate permease [Ignavibacteriota bacterium]